MMITAVEVHHMNIQSAGLRTPAGPRLRTWVSLMVLTCPMVEELLNGAAVVAILKRVGGERVPEGMAPGGLGAPGAAARLLHRPLGEGFVQVVAAALAGDAVRVLVEQGL